MAAVNYNNKRSGCYLGESNPLNQINEEIQIPSGQGKLDPGTVLGRVAVATASSAAKSGGNTGNGTLVLDATTPLLANAEPGVYSLRFTSTTNMRLETAKGAVLADIPIVATAGQTATINERIKAVVTEGSTTFAVGDGFDITVTAPTVSNLYKAHDPAATDGSQDAAAILFHPVDATSVAVKTVATVNGPATISLPYLTFKTGISAANKAAAIAALRAKHMKVLPQHIN